MEFVSSDTYVKYRKRSLRICPASGELQRALKFIVYILFNQPPHQQFAVTVQRPLSAMPKASK